MKHILIFLLIILNSSFAYSHRGDFLSIENVGITSANDEIILAYSIENITSSYYSGVKIELLINGVSVQYQLFNKIEAEKKYTNSYFLVKSSEVNIEKDLIQIEITKIFDKENDWGGWDSPSVIQQTNTTASEIYADAPWRMNKMDEMLNENPIPVHFFLHDADKVTGFTLKIDYINIKIKSASSSTFGNILTFDTIQPSVFESYFSCISQADPSLSVKQFDINSLSPTSNYTFDFDAETDFLDDFISIDDTYWYFTFNIPSDCFQGLDNIVDIEVTVSYANILFSSDDVIRMRVFRSESGVPKQQDYYRGDTHLHSIYTQNSAEMGLPLCSTKEAAKLIGLDWITTTDHTSDFDNYGTTNINTNWALIQSDVTSLNSQDSSLIYIAGQEVAANNSDNKLVHMLAYPSFANPFNLPFLGDGFGDLTPTNIDVNNVVSQLSAVDGFSYCAHPYASEDVLPTVPVNGGIWNLGDSGFPLNGSVFPITGGNIICNNTALESDVLDLNPNKVVKDAIKGSQIWNLRPTLEVSGLDGDNLDPWDVTNSGSPMSQVDTSSLGFHLKRLKQGQEVVNYINKLGLIAKNANATTQNWKMYYSAGSDAHGSFNSSNTDNFGGAGTIHNNAVGKVNTVAYCPNGMGENGKEVLKALYNGHISMSDGPIITIGLSLDGENSTNEILMGEDSVLDVNGKEDIFLNINYTTTPEFGDFTNLTFVVGTEIGEYKKDLTLLSTTGNQEVSFNLMNLLDSVFGGSSPMNEYIYIRSEIETAIDYSGMENEYRTTYDNFHSYTNPIWLKWTTPTNVEDYKTLKTIIYPNPAHSSINVVSNDNIQKIIIYDVYGRIAISKTADRNNNETINIEGLSTGVYLIEVYTEKTVVKQKIVAER